MSSPVRRNLASAPSVCRWTRRPGETVRSAGDYAGRSSETAKGTGNARSFLSSEVIQLAYGSCSAPVKYIPRRLTPRSRMASVLAVLCAVAGSTANAAAASRPMPSSINYYVSVGDSYAAGNQPTPSAWAHKDSNGFAYQVVKLARAKGYRFDLLNFGCGGATTTSVLQEVGCSADNPARTPLPTPRRPRWRRPPGSYPGTGATSA